MRVIIDKEIIYKAYFEDDAYCKKIFLSAHNDLIKLYISSYSLIEFIRHYLPKEHSLSVEFIMTLFELKNFEVLGFSKDDITNIMREYRFSKNDLEYSVNLQLLKKYSLNYYVTFYEPEKEESKFVIKPKNFVVSYL